MTGEVIRETATGITIRLPSGAHYARAKANVMVSRETYAQMVRRWAENNVREHPSDRRPFGR
jgi:hypothetical protein